MLFLIDDQGKKNPAARRASSKGDMPVRDTFNQQFCDRACSKAMTRLAVAGVTL